MEKIIWFDAEKKEKDAEEQRIDKETNMKKRKNSRRQRNKK